jgi:phosphate transport system substrate-binding protein
VAGAGADDVALDPKLAPYVKVGGVSGSLKSVGSDTMNNEVSLWTEGFQRFYPDVKIEVEGKGSNTAPPALAEGTAQFGAMSRAMKSDEMSQFEKRFSYKPLAVRSSIDCVVLIVNKDNPIAGSGLTLAQADAIFSKTRNGGYPQPISSWGDLGLTGEWASRSISLYGRNSASGTYGYIKSAALFNGDFRDEVKEQPGSSAVVQAVASDRYAIGYAGMGYLTADVKAVPLAAEAGAAPVEANMNNAYAGTYPLARFLLMYVNKHPVQPLDPLRLEFLKYILSREGQQDVIKAGYLPLPATIASQELEKLGAK